MNPSCLVEIGVEELPAGVLDLFYARAAENLEKSLKQSRLEFKSVRVEATPRRLVFFIEGLAVRQKDETTVLQGPAVDKAYEASGRPTPALEGFLRSRNASIKDVVVKETPKGRYITLEKSEKGKPAAKILPVLFQELLGSFNFPKTMRWEKTGFRFPRPIRWIVALHGKKVFPVSLAKVSAGRTSYGHRFLAPRSFSIPTADWKDYEKKLRKQRVIVALKDREQLISKELGGKFGQSDFDADLVHETAQLVEIPFLIQGKFSGTYRDLPEDVLATCMKKHQKIFAVKDGQGKLQNRFIAVLNGKRPNLNRIRHDFENVLSSRLRDAQHFYHEDTQEPLEKKVARLKELVFLGRLGTMEDRIPRLEAMAGHLSRAAGRADWEKNLKRTAFLAKADLVTQMVYEFPELQGIVGGEYAKESGEAPDTARAISEQYLPKNLSEDASVLAKKMSPAGALYGIVDRLDLLVGAFAIKLEPSGSEDPYALRRAGGALVKLVRAFSFRFSLSKMIEENYTLFRVKLDLSQPELTARLKDFLKERTAFELQAKPGTQAYEILQGILKSSFDILEDVFEKFRVLTALSKENPQLFLKTSKVVERTGNILKGSKEALEKIDPAFFQDPLEKDLFSLLQSKGNAIRDSLKRRNYKEATRLYGETFFEPLHHFFDKVMVNVEDASVRKNRQALMKEINQLYTLEMADLSALSQGKEVKMQ